MLARIVPIIQKNIVLLIHLSLAFVFSLVALYNTYPDKIIVFNDAPSLMSITEVRRFSFIYPENFGVNAGIQTAMNFSNLLVFRLIYHFFQNTSVGTAFFIFLILFLLWHVSFLGFQKLFKYFLRKEMDISLVAVFLVNATYHFGNFALQNMNTGITFSVSYIAYSFIPWIFYGVIKWPETTGNARRAYTIAIGLLGGSFLLHVPYMWPIFIGLITYLLFSNRFFSLFQVSKSVIFSLVIAVQVSAYFLYGFIFESVLNSSNFVEKNLENGVAGLFQGGLWYQFLQYSSWITYNHWLDRSVLTYAEYTQTIGVVAVTTAFLFAVFFLLPGGKRQISDIRGFVAVWLISLFFAKGFQQPLGSLFSYLIENFSIFGSIRTPDNKFGATAAFSTSVLLGFSLMFNKDKIKKRILVGVTICYLISTTLPLFTGEVLFGRPESRVYGGYIANIAEYSPVISYLESAPKDISILKIPGDVASYDQEQTRYVGRDVIRGYVSQTFEYAKRLRPKGNTYRLEGNSPVVQYILYYKNTRTLLPEWQLKQLQNQNELVLSTPTVDLYKTGSERRIVENSLPSSVIVHSASKYQVQVSENDGVNDVVLWQNFSPHYRLIPLSQDFLGYPEWLQDILFPVYSLTVSGLPGTARPEGNFIGVGWEIEVDEAKNFMIYYMPQAYFEIITVLSVSSTVIYTAFLAYFYRRGQK